METTVISIWELIDLLTSPIGLADVVVYRGVRFDGYVYRNLSGGAFTRDQCREKVMTQLDTATYRDLGGNYES